MPRIKKDTTVTIIKTPELSTELTTVVQSSKIDLNKAEMYAVGYAPIMQEVNEQNQIIKGLDKLVPDHAAIAKRASLDLGKIISRAKDRKAADKEVLLLETRHIDNLFNLVESTGRLGQADAKEIFEYGERVERERLDAVESMRKEQLIPYGTNTEFVNIRLMDDSTFTRFLANEKLLFEAQELERVKAEEARVQAEKEAEDERKRIEAQRIEEQRKKDAELKRMQDAEKARLEKEAADKKVRDALKAKRLKELEPFHSSASMMDLGGMSEPLFKDLLNTAKSEHAQRIHAQKEQTKKDEAARIERDRLAAIQAQKDKELQALRDKQAAELKAAQEKEAARVKAEQDAAKAPDRDKIRVWFEKFKALQDDLPAFKSKEGAAISVLIKTGMTNLRTLIITEAASLK